MKDYFHSVKNKHLLTVTYFFHRRNLFAITVCYLYETVYNSTAVSYTHLDVYKRQVHCGACLFDFMVLGSRIEKSSNVIQVQP